ncbi:MAG: hypothetical protein ACKVHP_23790, partial [Verrucomicrobiales bacterium]
GGLPDYEISLPTHENFPLTSIEVSGDLVEWVSGPSNTTFMVDDVSTLSVRDNAAFEVGQARFIRLTVER